MPHCDRTRAKVSRFAAPTRGWASRRERPANRPTRANAWRRRDRDRDNTRPTRTARPKVTKVCLLRSPTPAMRPNHSHNLRFPEAAISTRTTAATVQISGEKPNRTSRWHSLSPPRSNTHACRRTGLSLRPPVSTLPVLGARRPLFKQGLEARMVAERIQVAVLPEPLDVGESAADGFLDALQGPIEFSGQ